MPRKILLTALILYLIEILSISILNYSSLFNFHFFFILGIAMNLSLFRGKNEEFYLHFQITSLITTLIYAVQKHSIVHYGGLSGPHGIGTDDLGFYLNVTEKIGTLPYNYVNPESSYVKFLSLFKFLHIQDPLDILFLNVLPIIFVAYISKELYSYFFKHENINIHYQVLLCPILAIYSFILLRDGWVLFTSYFTIYALIKRNYTLAFFFLIATISLRLASGVLLFPFISLLIYNNHKNIFRGLGKVVLVATITSLLMISVILLKEEIVYFLIGKGITEDFVREAAVNRIVENGSGIFAKILSLPFYFRIPLSTGFYLVSPLINIDKIFIEDQFVIRNFISGIIFPILNLFYLPYILYGVILTLTGKNPKSLSILLVILILLVLVLAQISLQPRHKTILIPIYYITAIHLRKLYKGKKGIAWLTLFIILLNSSKLYYD